MACVLVVDDDDDVRAAMTEVLEDAGYEVMAAANGQIALERMRDAQPALVLLDLMMPIVDGWEVVREMRTDPALATIPVCVLSAMAIYAPPDTAAVLEKPVTVASLLDEVNRFCRPYM